MALVIGRPVPARRAEAVEFASNATLVSAPRPYCTACYRESLGNPLGHTTSFAHDADNRRIVVTDALGHTTSFYHDDVDRLLAVEDANSNITSYSYDNLDLLASVALPGTADDGHGYMIAVEKDFTYDADGNPLTVTD